MKTHNFILGLGRSPAAFIAYLEAKYPGYSAQLPLSNSRRPINELPERKAAIFAHLNEMLPPPSALNDKTLTVLDFSVSGKSLLGAQSYLRAFFETRGQALGYRNVAVKVLGLGWGGDESKFPSLTVSNSLMTALIHAGFVFYARYGSWDVARDVPGKVELQPKHAILVQETQRLMKRL